MSVAVVETLERLKEGIESVSVTAPRYGDIRRLFKAVLEGDVEHIEDIVPHGAPEGFKQFVVAITNIVRDVREGRLGHHEALHALTKLVGVDPATFILSLILGR